MMDLTLDQQTRRKAESVQQFAGDAPTFQYVEFDILPSLKGGDSWLLPSRFLFHRSVLLGLPRRVFSELLRLKIRAARPYLSRAAAACPPRR